MNVYKNKLTIATQNANGNMIKGAKEQLIMALNLFPDKDSNATYTAAADLATHIKALQALINKAKSQCDVEETQNEVKNTLKDVGHHYEEAIIKFKALQTLLKPII